MDIINVISLPHREDRLLSFCNQARWQRYAFKIWSGVEEFLTPAENVMKAHKQIIQFAKDNNHDRCFIAEDDVTFSNEGAWDYFLSQIPTSYDIFFSMIYSGEVRDGRLLNGFSGMTLYCVHKRFYDFFLSMPSNSNINHIDRALGVHCFEKEYYVCQPYVAKQMGGYSNNTRREENYRIFEENMTFY